MAKATPEDTNVIFLGSGALSWPWYGCVVITENRSTGEWSLTFRDEGDDDPAAAHLTYTVTHEDIMRAANKIARDKQYNNELRTECQHLIFGRINETDFDAITADWVIQHAAFGKCVYS